MPPSPIPQKYDVLIVECTFRVFIVLFGEMPKAEEAKQAVLYFHPMTTIDQLNARSQGTLPGLIGIEFTGIEPGRATSRLALRPELLAPNGYLHAAVVIAIADTTCGYGTITDLPERAQSFTTIELKSNFLNTTREGRLPALQHVSTAAVPPRSGTRR